MLPANGLVYVFPKSCSCFSMLHGFGALAPAYKRAIPGVAATTPATGAPATPAPASHELVQGPAYGKPTVKNARPDDWPNLRGDAYRSGSNPTSVPAALRTAWSARLALPACPNAMRGEWDEYPFSAGPITPPVVAEGLVFVAQ